MKEVHLGRYAGPFETIPFKSYIQSPIGLVPKANNKTRLIFHLSYDFGNEDEDKSLNHHTPEEMCHVKYNDVDCAIRACVHLMTSRLIDPEQSIFFAKTDLTSAFRILPILPMQHCLLVMYALHPRTNKKWFFVDKNLPFRASISC